MNEEIYLYGMTLMITSHRLAAGFPESDNYCETAESHRLHGGETGTCAAVLGNLGLTVHLHGNHLGRSTYPDLVSFFESSSVSLDLMTHDPDLEGLEDIVFVDQNTRTAFGQFCQFFQDLKSVFTEYANRTSGLTIFTFGADELWFGRKRQAIQRFTPYHVEVASTLGAGDSFKAGVIYAMAKGMADAMLVHFASATAAAACTTYPIAKDPPGLKKITEVAGESFECVASC